MNPNGNRDVVELWGREFNVVKSGLSEAQVVSFVNDLVKQHDVLLQRQEHLSALTKLAERTVTEAEKLAEGTKQETLNQAKSEAAKIVAEAQSAAQSEAARIIAEGETRAQRLAKEKQEQAMAAVAEQAEAIKSGATRLASELKKEAEAEALRTVNEAVSRGRHIVEQKEAEAAVVAAEQARTILSRAESEALTILERERLRVQPELSQFVRRLHDRLFSELDDLKTQVVAHESEFEETLDVAPSGPAFFREQKGGKRDELLELVGNNGDGDAGDPEWEIEILPPIDIMKIMSIVSYLDSLHEVAKTEIIPRNDRTSVTVYLNSRLDLADVVKALPEVASAEETSSSGGDGNKSRKISLALSVKSGVAGSL
jgi:vacuolar-type H+-ATPase subunit H